MAGRPIRRARLAEEAARKAQGVPQRLPGALMPEWQRVASYALLAVCLLVWVSFAPILYITQAAIRTLCRQLDLDFPLRKW